MAIDKDEVYRQINNFNNAPSTIGVANSKKVWETYYYVNEELAKDRSAFLSYLIANEPILNAIDFSEFKFLDLGFGSGNLTSHLVLDNFNLFGKILFNDKNTAKVNNDIIASFEDNTAEVLHHDFLLESEWEATTEADVVIFNPQTGGAYEEGNSKLEKISSVVASSNDLKEYLISQGTNVDNLTFEVSDHKILVKSNVLRKADLEAILKDIKVYNYHDVFYKSRFAQNEAGTATNIVKCRAVIDKAIKDDGLVIFYGELDFFNSLFADYNTVFEYQATDSHLFVALKRGESRNFKSFKKESSSFVEVDGSSVGTIAISQTGDIAEIESDIAKTLEELSEVTPVDDSLLSIDNQLLDLESKRTPFKIDVTAFGSLSMPYKNVLLKGVPGTGKSRLINKSFLKELKFTANTHPNILRINVHSASSNADLMQGIGISAQKGQIQYNEKQGLILSHLYQAISKPYQPFVIVLEEIQENSLNELIGDLIYLIEDEKRTDIKSLIVNGQIVADKIYSSIEEFLEHVTSLKFEETEEAIPSVETEVLNHAAGTIETAVNGETEEAEETQETADSDVAPEMTETVLHSETDVAEEVVDTPENIASEEPAEPIDAKKPTEIYYVKIPYLVRNETRHRILIVPNNLYFFCTSNYRDDKKIVEDNLLRRFDLIEMYPRYEKIMDDKKVGEFLESLNNSILERFNNKEIHPDRFMIGHASWINVKDKKSFCRALLKTITEFKDIREIEFSEIQPVLSDIKFLPFELNTDILKDNYKSIIDKLQVIAYEDLLNA